MASLVNSTKHLKRNEHHFFSNSSEREGKLLYEVSITLILKLNSNTIRKVNYRPIFLVYIHTKNEINKAITFIAPYKITKYQGINLAKKAKEFYTKNYKMLLKDVKEDK